MVQLPLPNGGEGVEDGVVLVQTWIWVAWVAWTGGLLPSSTILQSDLASPILYLCALGASRTNERLTSKSAEQVALFDLFNILIGAMHGLLYASDPPIVLLLASICRVPCLIGG